MSQTNRGLIFSGNKKPGEMDFRDDVVVEEKSQVYNIFLASFPIMLIREPSKS